MRARWWAWYVVAWVPVALLYAIAMAQTRAMSTAEALLQSTMYVLPPALLGVVVWWLTGKLRWPPRAPWRFVGIHAAAATIYTSAWVITQIGLIALGTGLTIALEISHSFVWFQAMNGLILYFMIAAGSHLLRVASRLRAEQDRAARAEALRVRAELAALRGQLNPHFLFNTLHTLTALVRRDPATAEHALERFGDMLRYVLDVKRAAREDVTLDDELSFVRTYLALEQLRLGDRLRVVEHVDPETLDCVLPSLTLQPVIENAIKYGIAPRARGGTLEISAQFDGEALVLEVRDDGPGAPSDVLRDATGMGLRAVRQRLETRYVDGARFVVTTAPAEGFVVRITLPAHAGVAAVPTSLGA